MLGDKSHPALLAGAQVRVGCRSYVRVNCRLRQHTFCWLVCRCALRELLEKPTEAQPVADEEDEDATYLSDLTFHPWEGESDPRMLVVRPEQYGGLALMMNQGHATKLDGTAHMCSVLDTCELRWPWFGCQGGSWRKTGIQQLVFVSRSNIPALSELFWEYNACTDEDIDMAMCACGCGRPFMDKALGWPADA